MKRTFVILIIAFLIFAVISFLEFGFNDRLADIFFAMCGVLFSVGMSQIMSFDFGKIIDREIYTQNTNALTIVRKSFVIHFALSSISYIWLQIIKSKTVVMPLFSIKGRQFSIEIFLNLIIIYVLFFFLISFHSLANKKATLDKTYRDEAMEDLE